MKKYKVIYADPPWEYRNRIGGHGTNVKDHYETMSMKELYDLDVKSISDKDCALFLWTTDSYLKRAISLMESWGFKYKTIAFVWLKLTPSKKPVYNPAPYTGKSCEICLLGLKGHVTKYIVERPKQFCSTIRQGHSEKPNQIRQRIQNMFPDVPKIELFERQRFDGWDAFGNEIESDVKL